MVQQSAPRSDERRTDGPTGAARHDRLAAGYFAAQAGVGVLLWLAVAASGTVRGWVELVPERHAVVNAFVLPDLGLVVVASLATARALATGRPSAVPLAALTAGAVLYPTLYLLSFVAVTGGTGVVALAIMVPPAVLTCSIAWHLARRR
jgi:hypothetical protein